MVGGWAEDAGWWVAVGQGAGQLWLRTAREGKGTARTSHIAAGAGSGEDGRRWRRQPGCGPLPHANAIQTMKQVFPVLVHVYGRDKEGHPRKVNVRSIRWRNV